MGQKDLAQNDYFNNKYRFADVCNGILFQGNDIIRPEDLQEVEPDIVYEDESEDRLRKIIPDKVRVWKGIHIGVLTMEGQSDVDYHMVFRMMKADALSYEKQWKECEQQYRRNGILKENEKMSFHETGKKVRFVPVIMIVIYYGRSKAWDGARCLYDMLDMDKELEPFINNYKMNLFDYHEYDDFSMFKTENRLLFETLACSQSKREMKRIFRRKRKEYETLDSIAAKTIYRILGLGYNQKVEEKMEKGKDMCKAIEDWIEEEREEGREEGILLSIKNLMESMKLPAVQALELLKVPEAEQQKYLALLN